jgi:hypothetical protein
MRRVMRIVFPFFLCSLVFAVPSLWASWVEDGVAICTASWGQGSPKTVSDGGGGAIITWYGNANIYAQRVDASGTPLWTTNGVAICTATGDQTSPQITSDGVGGAIITWLDLRGSDCDIYAQRVDASGSVVWTTNGVAICTATGSQIGARITFDGEGGAIVTWKDFRSGYWDIYAQRVDAAGSPDWTANGVEICGEAGTQESPEISADGIGGAVIAWQDYRNADCDIYAQRVNAAGTTWWDDNGNAVCTEAGDQVYPRISSDGAGGALVTWYDYRSGNYDIYAQRLDSDGYILWTLDGVAVCTATGRQDSPHIDSDGAGGAILAWRDNRQGNYDIYAQRLNASGTSLWTGNGVVICAATGDQGGHRFISDGAGGAVVTWADWRAGAGADVYAQQVDASGTPLWTVDGVPVCTAMVDQMALDMTTDGGGGAIVTWQDSRRGTNHIYAQLVDRQGRTGFLAPEIFSVRDVPGDQGGKVYVSWYAARPDIFMESEMSHYSIWRAISPGAASLALNSGVALIESLADFEISSHKPLVRTEQVGGLTYFWELMETVDAFYMEAYGKPVATLFDSTASCDEYHYFQVVAHTTDPKVFWKSEPDSGYSVDNIAPDLPLYLAGKQSFSPEGLDLSWVPNTETDLAHYAVYRGLSANFVPGPGNLIDAPSDTLCFDGDWRWGAGFFYKVSAIDIHGNESGFAMLSPDNITGEEMPKAPEVSFLSQNYPNPFNPTTRITFGLSAPGHVSLRIYDVAGRLVRMLAEGTRPAANYVEVWDGKDASGCAAGSGIYFCRLDAGSFTQTRKMILLR